MGNFLPRLCIWSFSSTGTEQHSCEVCCIGSSQVWWVNQFNEWKAGRAHTTHQTILQTNDIEKKSSIKSVKNQGTSVFSVSPVMWSLLVFPHGHNVSPEGGKLLLLNHPGRESYITSLIMSMKRAHLKKREQREEKKSYINGTDKREGLHSSLKNNMNRKIDMMYFRSNANDFWIQ